jgi:rare lipoprotein A
VPPFGIKRTRDADCGLGPAIPYVRDTRKPQRGHFYVARPPSLGELIACPRVAPGARGFVMARRNRFALAAICAFLFVADDAMAESGIASAYPRSYQGRRTASGEHLDTNAMTCAHKRYPFGSMLRVTAGEKSITCRVTDRGPFMRGRVIDLTPVAARALGFSGLAQVTIERM